MYYLEQAARVTVKAMSTGRPLKLISDEVGANLSVVTLLGSLQRAMFTPCACYPQ